jgi:hypothetical protein
MKLPITKLTEEIEKALAKLAAAEIREKHWVTHYGANDIHPRHLVYWICVQTDREKERLERAQDFQARLRSILDEYEYPIEGRAHVFIGFESQETVTRDSGGNWWHHWK